MEHMNRLTSIGLVLLTALAAVSQQGCVSAGGAAEKRWYKGNLHTHTLVSDGQALPVESAVLYRDAGYHFLMFSDHNRLHEQESWVNAKNKRSFNEAALDRFARAYPGLVPAKRTEADGRVSWRLAPFDETAAQVNEPDRFLLMSGCEYSDGILEENVNLHCNVVNMRRIDHKKKNVPNTDAGFGDMYADFLRIADTNESFFVVNHPIWWFYDVDPRVMATPSWDRMRFFEVSNNPGPDGFFKKQVLADEELMKVLYTEDRIWDYVLASRLLRGGPILYGLGTDDTHVYDKFYARMKNGKDFFRSWVCVRAEDLTERAIVGAMRRGDFYVANGSVPVELKDVSFKDGTLSLEVDPRPGVEYRIVFYGTKRNADLTCPGETVFDLEELARRLKCKKAIPPRYVGKSRHVPILPKAAGVVLGEFVGTRASYRLKADDLYVRAKVITPNGVAWTQPYSL